MNERTLFRTGITGAVVAAVCCFTPALVIALGAVGLASWLAWLDFVLLPLLAVSLGIMAIGLVRMRRGGNRPVASEE